MQSLRPVGRVAELGSFDQDVKAFFTLLPAVAVIAVVVFTRRPAIRFWAVALIVLTCFAVSGGLIAPHRVAEELVHGSPQSEQWRQGARDTRDAVYAVLPPLASAFVALVLLAFVAVEEADSLRWSGGHQFQTGLRHPRVLHSYLSNSRHNHVPLRC